MSPHRLSLDGLVVVIAVLVVVGVVWGPALVVEPVAGSETVNHGAAAVKAEVVILAGPKGK